MTLLHFASLRQLRSLSRPAYNTVYAVRFAHPNSAFGGTSHTPIPLYEIARISREKNKRLCAYMEKLQIRTRREINGIGSYN